MFNRTLLACAVTLAAVFGAGAAMAQPPITRPVQRPTVVVPASAVVPVHYSRARHVHHRHYRHHRRHM